MEMCKKQNKKILYIGNFGNKKRLSGSQAKKTVSIYNYLISKGVNVSKFNSENLKTFMAPFYIIQLLIQLLICKSVIVSLNKNGLKLGKYFLLKVLTVFRKEKMIFITIGGWLPDFLKENENALAYFKKFNKIYVQADEIVSQMHQMGLNNAKNMKNFRNFEPEMIELFKEKISSINYIEKQEIKLVFFAFNRKEKGLSDLVDAVNSFNKENTDTKYIVDVYGPVEKKYENEFYSIIEKNSQFRYRGILNDQTEIYEVLNSYDFMAFPSYYEGEGFPTVIVEGFISGLPIVASRWKFNEEIIISKYNGLLFDVRSKGDLLRQLNWITLNKDKIKQLRMNCLSDAMNYHTKKVLNDLFNEIH